MSKGQGLGQSQTAMVQEVINDDVCLGMSSVVLCSQLASQTLTSFFKAVRSALCWHYCAEFSCTVWRCKQACRAGQDRDTLGSSRSLRLGWCGGPWHHASLHAVERAGAWGQGTRHLWETTRPAVTHITTSLLRSWPSKRCLATIPNLHVHHSSIPLHQTHFCPIGWEWARVQAWLGV